MTMVGIAGALLLASSAPPPARGSADWTFLPGRVPLDWQGPDGNTIILKAPRGLIVIDTGRSPAHAARILEAAKKSRQPIAAIINTHWHLDHTTGNADIREVFPAAEVHATDAIEGALAGFLNNGRERAMALLADPKVPEPQKAQTQRGRDRIDNPGKLRPTVVVARSGPVRIAGRRLDLRVAGFAATEADLWIYDPRLRLAVVGDLVVDVVPFMDTSCTEGWLKALDDIAATPFRTLVPGHGAPMTRPQFQIWKAAFRSFVDCGRSSAPKAQCVDGWVRNAAAFIAPTHLAYARAGADYYLDARLRSSPVQQQRFCKSLRSPE